MSDAGRGNVKRYYLLRVWREGRGPGPIFVKSDEIGDMAVGIAFACAFLATQKVVPGDVREAARALVDAIRGEAVMPPILDSGNPAGDS